MDLKNISDKFSSMLNSKFENFYEEISNYMLEEFKAILESLYKGDIESVNAALQKISQNADVKIVESEIFQEIGKLTRELHNDIKTFVNEVQPEIQMLTDGEVSQATNRLRDVIKLTEKSANSTLDLSEQLLDSINKQSKHIGNLKLVAESMDDKELQKDIESIIKVLEEENENNNMLLMEIMTAQEFQDRVGQTIKKVIVLVEAVEERLILFITKFGGTFKHIEKDKDAKAKVEQKVEEYTEKPKDTFSDKKEQVGQDGIDDLLSQFGF